MRTYLFTYWNGDAETVRAESIADALVSIYGPVTETGYTSDPHGDNGVCYTIDNGSATVTNSHGDHCATITTLIGA